MGGNRQEKERQIADMLDGGALRLQYAEIGYDLSRLSVGELQVMRRILRKAAVDDSEEPGREELDAGQTSAIVVGCESCGGTPTAVCRSCGAKEDLVFSCSKCRGIVRAVWLPSEARRRRS